MFRKMHRRVRRAKVQVARAQKWAEVSLADTMDYKDCSLSTFRFRQSHLRRLEEQMGRLDARHASVWQRLAWLIFDVRLAGEICYTDGTACAWTWGDWTHSYSMLLDVIHATALAWAWFWLARAA